MLNLKNDFQFIEQQTKLHPPVNSGEESAFHNYLLLCYSRLNDTVTCILILIQNFNNLPKVYYGICLLIRPILIDILSIQYMLSIIKLEGDGDEQISKLEEISNLYLKDGVNEIWEQGEIDFKKNIRSKKSFDELQAALIKHYPDTFEYNNTGKFQKIKGNRSYSAKYLYKHFPQNPFPDNEKVIAMMFEQYNMFSKVEHLSDITSAVLNISLDKKIEEINKSKFFLLVHLDSLFQLFKNVDLNFIEPSKIVREKMECYFKPEL